jgi:hypothetical protein
VASAEPEGPPCLDLVRVATSDCESSPAAAYWVDGITVPLVLELRRNLRRSQVEGFFAKLPPTEVVLATRGGLHGPGTGSIWASGLRYRTAQAGHMTAILAALPQRPCV